ncbi:MAG: hypothetical protein ACXWCO_19140, partial [Caldimonas sp.]
RLAPVFIRAMGHRNFRRYGISGERIGMVHKLCSPHEFEEVIAATTDALLHGERTDPFRSVGPIDPDQ